jgi:hypothetical protein
LFSAPPLVTHSHPSVRAEWQVRRKAPKKEESGIKNAAGRGGTAALGRYGYLEEMR